MDDRATRGRDAERLRSLITQLEVDGGDAVVVLLGMAERLALGVDRYGALDLDEPHDWQLEEDEERCDVENYRAIRRAIRRRGAVSRSADRRSTQPLAARFAAARERMTAAGIVYPGAALCEEDADDCRARGLVASIGAWLRTMSAAELRRVDACVVEILRGRA